MAGEGAQHPPALGVVSHPAYFGCDGGLEAVASHSVGQDDNAAPWEARTPDLEVNSLTL